MILRPKVPQWERYAADPVTSRAWNAANPVDDPNEPDEGEVVELFTDYRPHAKQREFHAAKSSRFVAVNAGRRSGKTHAGGREFLDRVMDDFEELEAAWQDDGDRRQEWEQPDELGDETTPSLHYWVVAPTYDLCVYPKREIFAELGGSNGPLVIKWHQSKNRLWLRGGILIEFKSAERPRRLVAAGLNGLWVEEAARVKESTWRDNIRPALSDKLGWAIFTSTPLGTSNWFYQDVWQKTQHGDAEQRDENYFGVTFHTADNTALPHLQEEVAAARRELPPAMFRRNYQADFNAFEGKIYESFVDGPAHIVDKIPYSSFVRRIGVVDWGFGNPGVLLEIGIDADGRWWVYNEVYASGRIYFPPKERAEAGTWLAAFREAKARGVTSFWADPSGAKEIAAARSAGLNFKPAENEVNAGIDVTAAMLHPFAPEDDPDGKEAPSLFIAKSCTNLRRELGSYRWGDNGKPVKEDDHTVDALRYGMLSEYRKSGGFKQLERFSSIFKKAA